MARHTRRASPPWAAGESAVVTYYHAHQLVYHELATGGWRGEVRSAAQVPDLDLAGLAERICAPLRRPLAPNDDPYDTGPLYEDYLYERPFAFRVVHRERAGMPLVDRLVMQRCGSPRRGLVARCRPACTQVRYSAGVLTWASPTALHAYVPSTGRRYGWRLSGFRPDLPSPVRGLAPEATIAHTRQRLIASILTARGGTEWSIWAARLPATRGHHRYH